ncbi:uncharacterized protein LOC142578815 isoform X1 [Dermacentor variabilis]|uniref:uncharacterized protein LOC142578815 isoform X1 n=1 Tax=Dermacentor variabilis TaxID=34621 RepID=UPI003F5C13FD
MDGCVRSFARSSRAAFRDFRHDAAGAWTRPGPRPAAATPQKQSCCRHDFVCVGPPTRCAQLTTEISNELRCDRVTSMGGSLSNPKLQSWPLLSLMPREGALESLHLRSRQRPHAASYSVEGDDDGGLDSQDESRRAKLRGKACYFKICPFNTRSLYSSAGANM